MDIIPKVWRFSLFLTLAKGHSKFAAKSARTFAGVTLAHCFLWRNGSAWPRAACASPVNSVRRIPIPNEMISTPITINAIAMTGKVRGGAVTAADGVGVNTTVAVAIGIGVIVGSDVVAMGANAVGDGSGVGVGGTI